MNFTVGIRYQERGYVRYKILGISYYCCEKIKEARENNFIGVGDYDDYGLANKPISVNIYKCEPYPEGAVWESMPIKFCPFCGKKIKLDIIQEN